MSSVVSSSTSTAIPDWPANTSITGESSASSHCCTAFLRHAQKRITERRARLMDNMSLEHSTKRCLKG